METETDDNQQIIHEYWSLLVKYLGLSKCVKHTQKCVRQTMQQVTQRLNEQYHFEIPVKFEHKRLDTWSKEEGKKSTKYWIIFSLT